MHLSPDFISLGISLGLGLLVGMQRERAGSRSAGFRTFAMITLLGTLTAMLAPTVGGWIVAAGLICVAAAMAVANMIKLKSPDAEPGMTTEIAALVMFAVGAYLVVGQQQVAVVVGAAVAVLLHAKFLLHSFAHRIGEKDMRAMMQFVLIAMVILPVLPNETFGPFEVLNPREIWMIVVLVVGISFAGYIALKLFGQNAGAVLGGILGGLVSSTATTVSYSKRASESDAHVNAATLVIMIAATVVYGRVLAEVAVVARPALPAIAGPIGIMAGAAIVISFFVWLRNRRVKSELPEQDNPTELKSAIGFGIMYAVISFTVAAAKYYFNDKGIYVVAAVSGLTDMDAITLSTARMAANNTLETTAAWRAILIASMANLAFKIAIVGVLGGTKLFRYVLMLFGLNMLVGIAILIFWPS
jgi:uncharacterized membrane protein (DUF4010 family)